MHRGRPHKTIASVMCSAYEHLPFNFQVDIPDSQYYNLEKTDKFTGRGGYYQDQGNQKKNCAPLGTSEESTSVEASKEEEQGKSFCLLAQPLYRDLDNRQTNRHKTYSTKCKEKQTHDMAGVKFKQSSQNSFLLAYLLQTLVPFDAPSVRFQAKSGSSRTISCAIAYMEKKGFSRKKRRCSSGRGSPWE